MTKNYSYIPNKENLFILLKSEYENIIRQLKQNKEVHSFNTVNKSIIPQKVINTFELLMLKTVFIKLEYIQLEKCSYLYFLDDDLEIISKNTIPTSYAKHITDIYNNKDWL
ncbi:hypothetical protein [Staphylococcus capitis]|uniref:hypothetical protein n=1 Tax=Staphylococcus capitis TaxID=29388 RepID=UPI00321A0C2A